MFTMLKYHVNSRYFKEYHAVSVARDHTMTLVQSRDTSWCQKGACLTWSRLRRIIPESSMSSPAEEISGGSRSRRAQCARIHRDTVIRLIPSVRGAGRGVATLASRRRRPSAGRDVIKESARDQHEWLAASASAPFSIPPSVSVLFIHVILSVPGMFNCLLLSLLPHINTAAAVVSRPREMHWGVLLIYYIFYAFSRRFYPKRLTGYIFFYQYVCSLGIEPTTFCAANAMFYHWDTGTRITHYACYGGIFWAFMCVRIIYHLFDTKQQHFWPPHTSIPIFLSRYRQLTGFWDTTQCPPVTQQFRGHLFSVHMPDITHLESSGLPEKYIYIYINKYIK